MSEATTSAEARSPERARTLDYLRSRAATLAPSGLRARFRAAAAELEAALAGVTEAEARRRPPDGGWSLAQIVDHVAQTTIRSADELRHLLAGRRPPLPPVYESLTSGAAAWVPWEELLAGLRSANAELEALIGAEAAAAGETGPAAGPTVRTIIVVNRTLPDGAVVPDVFDAELDRKEYVLVQRLHLLDHRNQVRQVRAALAGAAETR